MYGKTSLTDLQLCGACSIILHYFGPPVGGTRGHSSEEAPQTRSGYATTGSYVPPSTEYTTPYEKPVAAPVGPVVVGPTEPVPHYESQY